MDEERLALDRRRPDRGEPAHLKHVRLIAAGLACALAATACADGTPPPAGPSATPTGAVQPASGATASPRWERTADIPTPRSEVAAAGFRDAIYVVGGFGGTNVVERYLPGRGVWERAPDLPIGVDHPMAAAIGTGPHAGVYVMGGNSGGRPTARVFLLAPDATSWREMPPMPSPRSAGAAVAYYSLGHEALPVPPRIWVVGGQSGDRLEPATLEYDPVQDRWSQRADIPTPRDHLAAAYFEGKICAIGGRLLSMSRNLPAFECFDAAANAWERLAAAPTARGGVGAAVVGRRLYFIGGEQPSGTFREVEIYDGRTRAWTRGPDLPEGKHGIGVAAFGSGVYVMTGGPTPGGSQSASAHVLEVPPTGAD